MSSLVSIAKSFVAEQQTSSTQPIRELTQPKAQVHLSLVQSIQSPPKLTPENPTFMDHANKAMALGWTKAQLWATGTTDHRKMTPYQYLLNHGGEIYEITKPHIAIHTTDDKFTFFYRTADASPFKFGIPEA